MQEEANACQVSWGAHVYALWHHKAKDHTVWANRSQQESWTEKGLIVSEAKSQRIVRLSATEVLSLLEYLHRDDLWKEQGIVLGEPCTLTTTLPL